MSIKAIENSPVIPRPIKDRLILAKREPKRVSVVQAKRVSGRGIERVDIRQSDIHFDSVTPSHTKPFHISGIGIDPNGNPYMDSKFRCWYQPSTGEYTPRFLLSTDVPYLMHVVSGPSARSSYPGSKDDRKTVSENAVEILTNRADFKSALGRGSGLRRLVAGQYLAWIEESGRVAWSNNSDRPEAIPRQYMRVRSKGRIPTPYPLNGTI